MNTHNPNSWPPSAPQGPPPNSEQQVMQQRPPGSFGPSMPLQQGPQHQVPAPSIMPQPTSFFTNQPNGHTLPNPQSLPPQASPMQTVRGPPPPQSQQQSPPSLPHPPPQPHYGLPALGPPMSQQSPPAALQADSRHIDRERQEHMRRMLQQEQDIAHQRYEQESDMIHRQREEQAARDMQARERQQRGQLQSPRENHAGTVPLQQPIANRVTGSLHGPNGILNEQHMTSPSHPQPAHPLGAPSGPGNVFSGSMQPASDPSSRTISQQIHPSVPPQQPLIHLTNAAAPPQTNGVNPMNQQQQPILNDALSYLDQVKVRFQDQPDVYNQFLDIMKDFKSQAIDTPGVIERVSSLFAGHPELIQGFNTFLPPGYRIECGLSDDPNIIRVTTPMGTSNFQMPAASNRLAINGVQSAEPNQSQFYPADQQREDWIARQQEVEQQDTSMGGPRPVGPGPFAPQPNEPMPSYEEQAQADVQGLPPNLATSQHLLHNLESKRGPVEFNHAIGYVNKIKNRFSSQPEIYKQFLEILQTYQRESKPIGDVYAQVTQLFNAAPDLLEDFKQFLPESAAQAKAAAQAAGRQVEEHTPTSNLRGDANFGAGGTIRNQAQTPRPGDYKLPPVGTFAPPSVGKDNKKRRGGAGSQLTGGANAVDTTAGTSNRNRGGNAANKRARIEPTKPTAPEAPLISPSLVPALPTPLPPSRDPNDVGEGIQFFERVKKLLNNRGVFNEFLKICNLFNQEILDKDALVQKVHGFIGGNSELFNWFKNWIGYDGHDKYIENNAKIPSGKVVLSNCRGYGPSYRLLPKRERLRVCSGRDEMCNNVLNDEWVSHPTWASEESGFIAHRKNGFEEALHRIEEERHDYDINVEACVRTIQLLEPIAQSLKLMSEEDRLAYQLPPGIGGQSETIYQRVIKKIYDRERGAKVIEDMFRRPSAVIPILLGRLKQKAEEWKASQREWEKVWRAQTNTIFWKSLDHQGITIKAQDKRQFQPKTLHTEIQAKYEEQRRQRMLPWSNVPKYQFMYEFHDFEVVYDACHLILTSLHNSYAGNEIDKNRLDTFLKTFIPTFFDIDRDAFEEKMNDIEDSSPPNEENDDELNTDAESSNVRGRRGGAAKKQDLLRGVLDRAKTRDGADESGVTTPDVHSNDGDTPASTGTPTEQKADPEEHRWMSYPTTGNETADLNVPFKRDDFHLYATSNIYCFMRMFQGLYERLLKIKQNEQRVNQDVSKAKMAKPANELGLVDKSATDYFHDTSSTANYYKQVVQMCEEVVKSEVELQHLEETLRRFYMHDGWPLYSFEKMLGAILRFALQILVSDNKDKSLDIINLFYKDRKEDETTHQNELTYRKQVEKLGKDGDIFRIRYNRPTRTAYVQIFKKDDKTYEADELAATARWSYYVSTYSMFDHTEGVSLSSMRLPYLRRNMLFPPHHPPKVISSSSAAAHNAASNSTSNLNNNTNNNNNATASSTNDNADADLNGFPLPMYSHDGLVIRISPNNYHLLYDPFTSDWWVQSAQFRKRGLSGMEEVREERRRGLERLMNGKEENQWMRDAEGGEVEVEGTKKRFERWIREGPETLNGDVAAAAGAVGGEGRIEGGGEERGEDEQMGGT